jgi:hypothetical protein
MNTLANAKLANAQERVSNPKLNKGASRSSTECSRGFENDGILRAMTDVLFLDLYTSREIVPHWARFHAGALLRARQQREHKCASDNHGQRDRKANGIWRWACQ